MKTKIVLWGTRETEEKVLVAIELVESENLVKTHLIKEEDATEIFYNRMLNEWRFNSEIEFPEGTQSFEKNLTLSEDILPDGIKVERPDLILRAKTEWHFVVLSKKLYDLYKAELEDFREKISELSEFDNGIWEELKGFWSKVQGQINDKNLFRNHIDALRKETDDAFKQLKELKRNAEKEIREESKKHFTHFSEIMEKMEEKIESGLGLQPIFEELKDIQQQFKNTNFSREHRKQLWDRIDQAFKNVKEKRYGSSSEDRSPLSRLTRRYEGLLAAIQKMERSIERDKKEVNQQDKQAASSLGQLELEIRKVKMSMVEERIQSKEEKLQDMLKTKTMLEGRIKSEQEREEKRKMFEEAKKEAEEKIAQEILERNEELEKKQDELLKAAEKITSETKHEESEKEKAKGKKGILTKISETMEDLIEEGKEIAEDLSDTVRAVSEVMEDRAEKKLEELEGKVKKFGEEMGKDTEGLREKIEDAMEKVEDKMDETIEKIRDKFKKTSSSEEE